MDGTLVSDSRKGLRINPEADYPLPPWFDVTSFSNGLFGTFSGFDERTTHKTSPALFRLADVRLYLDVLTDSELQKVHVESRWPVGTEWPPQGDIMRQVLLCIDNLSGASLYLLV